MIKALAAAGLLAAALITGCSASAQPVAAHAPCTPAAQVQAMYTQVGRDGHNAANGVAIPAGARWPEAAQLAANPQYGAQYGGVSSLYWTWREAADSSRLATAAPVC
jgi:hypothetical protein